MAVFLIDFDLTITSQHTHNLLEEAMEDPSIANDEEKQWEIFKAVLPVRSAEAWLNVFTDLQSHGHKIAFLSFSSYPALISRYIKEVIKFTNPFALISWTPKNPSTANKNQHVKQALTLLEYRPTDGDVVFIDDTERNIYDLDRILDCITVLANTATGSHIDKILDLSEELPMMILPEALPQGTSYSSPLSSNHSTRPKVLPQPATSKSSHSRDPFLPVGADKKVVQKLSFTTDDDATLNNAGPQHSL